MSSTGVPKNVSHGLLLTTFPSRFGFFARTPGSAPLWRDSAGTPPTVVWAGGNVGPGSQVTFLEGELRSHSPKVF